MTKLILTRHGQSVWNAENRFTGWVDVDLSEKGVLEAEKSGQIIKDLNIKIDIFYTSYLKRAIRTLTTILQKNNGKGQVIDREKLAKIIFKNEIVNTKRGDQLALAISQILSQNKKINDIKIGGNSDRLLRTIKQNYLLLINLNF